MRIKKVRISGFDKLYDGYKMCIQENRSGFGTGFYTFLNHIMISLELEDITSIELFYLKKISSKIKIIDHKYRNFIEKRDALDLNQKISGLLKIHNSIIDDEDIDKSKCCPDNILPIGCHQYHVFVIFKGSNISAITGSLIQKIFKDKDNKFENVYVGNEMIEDRIASLFYSSFYSFISSEMTNIDIITEFMTDKAYYKYADSICSISHVNSPFGELSLYGNNSTGLKNQINYIKKSMETSPYDLSDMINLTFCLRTTFHTFLNLYLNTPYVIDHENLKLTFSVDDIFVDSDILSKYRERIMNSFEYLNDFKKGLARSSEIDLQKFNYIFYGNPITYSIQIPLSDILHGKINSETLQILNNEMCLVCSEISKLTKTIFDIFN